MIRLECQWCPKTAAKIVRGQVVLRGKHHGDYHDAGLDIGELIRLSKLQGKHVLRCPVCGDIVADVMAGNLNWTVKHNGASHEQSIPVLRLASLSYCAKLVSLSQVVEPDLAYLVAASQSFQQREATKRLGVILERITSILQT